MHTQPEYPRVLASIRNFAWVEPRMLARGEQPALEAATFDALREEGVTAVVSLRPDREPPSSPTSRRPWPEYHIERRPAALASAAGLRFRNVPIADFSAPSPEQVASALTVLDELIAEQPGVYVHCRAGAGRAELVSGVWAVTRGQTGDDAADNYVRFMEHIGASVGFTADEWSTFVSRVGQPFVWWALCEIVDALGSPVTREQPRLLAPERPPDADHWEPRYRELLRPWHRHGAER